MQDLNKQAFQEAKKWNIKDWIKVYHTNNSLYQEYELNHLPIIHNKVNTNHKLNEVGINEVRNFINISDEYLFVKTNSLDHITPWMMREYEQTAEESR